METAINILIFILVLGVLITIHELGHFLSARWMGMRADVFAVGMGPRLLGWNRLTGFTFGPLKNDWDGGGHTDYRLALFPIGGYVKIAGMIDESLDTNQLSSEIQPWEFRAKGMWAKAFVISAGVIMNALLAIVLLAGVAWYYGEEVLESNTVKGVAENSIGKKIGLQSGDKILAVDGKHYPIWNDIVESILLENSLGSRNVTVVREGEKKTLSFEGTDIINMMNVKSSVGLVPEGSVVVLGKLMKDYPAETSGLISGDTAMAVNGLSVAIPQDFKTEVSKNGGKVVLIEVKRASGLHIISITPNSSGLIGAELKMAFTKKTTQRHYSLLASISRGFSDSKRLVETFIGSIAGIFAGKVKAKDSVGGVISMYKVTSESADAGAASLLRVAAMISLTLAVLNILPIPVLDGGHLVFIFLEGILRREVPQKIKIAFQYVGMALLFGLMIFALINDIMKL